jgi:hypothetical protein
MRVRRRNGGEEEFVGEKIVVAIVKAGGSLGTARGIAQDLERTFASQAVVATEDIKKEVLRRLKEKDPKAYEGWIAYDASRHAS